MSYSLLYPYLSWINVLFLCLPYSTAWRIESTFRYLLKQWNQLAVLILYTQDFIPPLGLELSKYLVVMEFIAIMECVW